MKSEVRRQMYVTDDATLLDAVVITYTAETDKEKEDVKRWQETIKLFEDQQRFLDPPAQL